MKSIRVADMSPTPEFIAELNSSQARQRVYDSLVAVAADADRSGETELWKAACEALAAVGKAFSR